MTKGEISRLANLELASLRAIYMKMKHQNYSNALHLYTGCKEIYVTTLCDR
jgi:hypothetical protein